MRFVHRLQKLERMGIFTRTLPPLDRYLPALNAEALRLTGKDYRLLTNNDPQYELVMEEAMAWCFREMSAPDRDALREELARIAFGDDTAARKAVDREAEQEALARLGLGA